MSQVRLETTPIAGLLVIRLPLHGDNRGWFKENWQRAKMTALGLPDFAPVQQNVSFNSSLGVTRGIHAEPWDKLISITQGRIMGAWVDLREGAGFGTQFTLELGPETAVFVPRGVGNGYQTLAPDTCYTYLVNDHWDAAAKAEYTYVNLFDPALGLQWPIPQQQAEISAADATHPGLADVVPMRPAKTLVVGANGQLGRALLARLPNAVGLNTEQLDITDSAAVANFGWRGFETIINAAAYTAVDAAETATGRQAAWQVNAAGVGHLATAAREHRLKLVHISSDYVFDGTNELHLETEAPSPLGVYGQSKAAGDLLAQSVPQHWIIRTSWVIGQGKNFVSTMAALADQGSSPAVVADQFGRLTFTTDLADGIIHLLTSDAAPGSYNLTNTGPVQSWADIAARVFELRGRSRSDVTPISTSEYSADKQLAPRPRHSTLGLDKLLATGFSPADADHRLIEYLAALP